MRTMNVLQDGFPTRVARCSAGYLWLDGEAALRRGHLELLQQRRRLSRGVGALADGGPPYPIAHGLDLVQDEADVPPRVAGTDLRRPLQEQGEHTELDVAGDPVGRPVVDGANAQARRL